MKEKNFSTSACRHCRFYEPEGRRGGSCQILGVPVQSSWKACDFACPPFDTTLETSIALDSPERMIPQLADNQIKGDRSQLAVPKTE